MFLIDLQIINWAFISEKTRESVYYLAQNINLIKSVVLRLNMVRYTLSIIIQWHTLVAYWIKLGESMALKVINKLIVDSDFYIENWFLSPLLPRLLCNSLIQPQFVYACSAWYPRLNKRLNSKLQILQNLK